MTIDFIYHRRFEGINMPYYPLLTLNIGTPKPFRDDDTLSTMARQPVCTAVKLTKTGFSGDQVADPKHHGGMDKALHHYPHDHYNWWREQLGAHPLLERPGAFGENIATMGLTEQNACIGDRFRLGGALIEVSHGRQPCWKLDHHFQRTGKDSVMAHIVRSGKCGLYFRVLEEAMVSPDDGLEQVESGLTDWPVSRVFDLLIAGGHKSDPAAVKALAQMGTLATAWRARALKLSA